MAELVESLISITHLNRRITMSEEGVGGPIDVAIISKGDGFVWKKRKHYFKPELNQMFFDNYFRRLASPNVISLGTNFLFCLSAI